MAGLEPVAYGGHKDVGEAWAAGVLAVRARPAAAPGGDALAVPQHLREPWAERVAIMVMDGGLPRELAPLLLPHGVSVQRKDQRSVAGDWLVSFDADERILQTVGCNVPPC